MPQFETFHAFKLLDVLLTMLINFYIYEHDKLSLASKRDIALGPVSGMHGLHRQKAAFAKTFLQNLPVD